MPEGSADFKSGAGNDRDTDDESGHGWQDYGKDRRRWRNDLS